MKGAVSIAGPTMHHVSGTSHLSSEPIRATTATHQPVGGTAYRAHYGACNTYHVPPCAYATAS